MQIEECRKKRRQAKVWTRWKSVRIIRIFWFDSLTVIDLHVAIWLLDCHTHKNCSSKTKNCFRKFLVKDYYGKSQLDIQIIMIFYLKQLLSNVAILYKKFHLTNCCFFLNKLDCNTKRRNENTSNICNAYN